MSPLGRIPPSQRCEPNLRRARARLHAAPHAPRLTFVTRAGSVRILTDRRVPELVPTTPLRARDNCPTPPALATARTRRAAYVSLVVACWREEVHGRFVLRVVEEAPMRRGIGLTVGIILFVVSGVGGAANGAPAASDWRLFSGAPFPANSYVGTGSCMGSGVCVFGGDGPPAVAARLVRGRWQALSMPASTEDLGSISCVSGRRCEAIIDGAPYALAGDVWTAQRYPTRLPDLISVDCISATSCVAVGSGTVSESELIERWDGHVWRVQATPQPRLGGALLSVACSSASAPTSSLAGAEPSPTGPVAQVGDAHRRPSQPQTCPHSPVTACSQWHARPRKPASLPALPPPAR
jgi:hypothetical protein